MKSLLTCIFSAKQIYKHPLKLEEDFFKFSTKKGKGNGNGSESIIMNLRQNNAFAIGFTYSTVLFIFCDHRSVCKYFPNTQI